MLNISLDAWGRHMSVCASSACTSFHMFFRILLFFGWLSCSPPYWFMEKSISSQDSVYTRTIGVDFVVRTGANEVGW